jgi:deoxyribodipyrimidine photo-lyase
VSAPGAAKAIFMAPSIWWIRRDIRLTDNPALHAALANGDGVIPLFILDPKLWQGRWFSQRRGNFLLSNLKSLDAELRKRGSQLIIRQGQPKQQLSELVQKFEVNAIFSEEDLTPYARKRDSQIAETLPLHLVGNTSLHHPSSILKNDGTPYKVYTPFMRRWKEKPPPTPFNILSAPNHIPTPKGITSQPLPEVSYNSDKTGFLPGEKSAQEILAAFTDGPHAPIFSYQESRNRPDLNSTSKLSPYFRFGLISIRQAVTTAFSAIQAAKNDSQRNSAETWLNELIWREFFNYILYHYPNSLHQSFRKEYRDLPWINDKEDFSAWKAGRTGFPVVDAAMRQLAETGWMHNRTRMVTASFLVKNLLIDWRWGEAWFMKNLLDGDPAANNGGWQWVAGTGTDAAPYFRIFNPITQSQKFDPSGKYIRRWVPELHSVPDRYIHAPWKMSLSEQQSAKCLIGTDYPEPIIDLQFSRQRTLDAYQKARS